MGFLFLITDSNDASMSETINKKTCEQPSPIRDIDVQTVWIPLTLYDPLEN